MSEKILHSITAIFDTPDDIIHAAEKVSEKGYKLDHLRPRLAPTR